MPSDAQAKPPLVSPANENLQPMRHSTTHDHTYVQILKSSALIGVSSVLNTAIRIGRTKAMAVLLGPAGFGLMGMYGAIEDFAASIAGMGTRMSGVRQIAAAVSSEDTEKISQTVTALRRITILLALAGAVLMVAFCRQVSIVTFGNDEHGAAVALLSLALLFRLITDAQSAVIHGMRRIADLAKIGPIGTLLGAVISVALVYILGERGLVPAAVGSAAMALLVAWWYCRQIGIQALKMTVSQVRHEAAGFFRLGIVFMASNMLTIGATYAVRIIVLRKSGLEAAGLYQSASALGSLYVGIILQAMSTDFYPRLVGVADRNTECNRLVNEQAQVSLLLAGPGVAATLTFAPLLIPLFYSAKFVEAVVALQWICIGMALRVIAWPMGTVMLAKNTRKIFFWSELAWTLVGIGLAWTLVDSYGLNGAGMAFFGAQVFHAFMTYPIIRHLSGFRWSVANRKTGLLFLCVIGAVFGSFYMLPPAWATGLGALVTLLSSVFSIRALLGLVSLDQVPPPVKRLLVIFHFATPRPRQTNGDGG